MKIKSIQLILLVAVFFVIGCSEKNQNESGIPRYQVITPYLLDTSYSKEYVASIQSVRNVEIRARVEGQLQVIHVDEGQPVKEGQLLRCSGKCSKQSCYRNGTVTA